MGFWGGRDVTGLMRQCGISGREAPSSSVIYTHGARVAPPPCLSS